MKKARGMPSVALSQQTQDYIKAEEEKEIEEAKEDPFVKPNLEVKVIDEEPTPKPTEDDVGTIEEAKEPVKIKKPKKKLTEKQLEALKRGRIKSAETRKKNAEAKKKLKEETKAPKNHIQTQNLMPQQQQQKKQEVEFNVKEFEKKVRDEERLRVLGEIETLQKEEEMAKSHKVATQTLKKQPQSVNPFSYAFNMNSRSRYKRY